MRPLLCFSGVSPSPLNIPKSGREQEPEQGGCQAMGPASPILAAKLPILAI